MFETSLTIFSKQFLLVRSVVMTNPPEKATRNSRSCRSRSRSASWTWWGRTRTSSSNSKPVTRTVLVSTSRLMCSRLMLSDIKGLIGLYDLLMSSFGQHDPKLVVPKWCQQTKEGGGGGGVGKVPKKCHELFEWPPNYKLHSKYEESSAESVKLIEGQFLWYTSYNAN